ncbi:MAG: LysR family transcriptional regulator [Pseudomonadota bacterium]|nr:LysR family transcriptional regulator [Pseudomonadota bacterium]
MERPLLPLNALRAFEASARHLSFTRAAIELCVTQAAVSHQVKALEQRLGFALFKRLPRGLLLTREGETLLPAMQQAFDRISDALGRFESGHYREPLMVGVVGTFAVGWLLPRLAAFETAYPWIDLRLSTNNNRVDIAAEGLDCAIRFGAGAWHGTHAEKLMDAPFTLLCAPDIAARLHAPADALRETVLRSYRGEEWPRWLNAAGLPADIPLRRAIVFDSSLAMMEAARQGAGVALVPAAMFAPMLEREEIHQPFEITFDGGGYWLARLQSRTETAAMRAFRQWLGITIGGQEIQHIGP